MSWGSSDTPSTARLGRGLESMFSFSLVSDGYTSVTYSIMLGREERREALGRELSELGGVVEHSEWEQGLFAKIDGERMTGCLWETPVCGKSHSQ